MALRRDRCSVCLGEYTLTRDGMLRWHLGDRPNPHGGRLVCDGSGKPPAVMYKPDWAWLIRPEADGDA